MVVRVDERALNGEDSRVSSLLPRSVITASITTLGLNVGNGEVLFDQSHVELGQLAVGEVGDDAYFLPGPPLDPRGHIELAHSDDLDTAGFVVIGDSLRTQKANFLNTPVSTTHKNVGHESDIPQLNTSGTRRCDSVGSRIPITPCMLLRWTRSHYHRHRHLGGNKSVVRKHKPVRRSPYRGRGGMGSC